MELAPCSPCGITEMVTKGSVPPQQEAGTKSFMSKSKTKRAGKERQSSSGGSSSNKKKKNTKPHGYPRRVLTAYNLFFRDQRKVILEERKRGVGNTSANLFESMARTVAERWKALSADQVAYYEDLSQLDEQRYCRELEVYQQKLSKTCPQSEIIKPAKASTSIVADRKQAPQELIGQNCGDLWTTANGALPTFRSTLAANSDVLAPTCSWQHVPAASAMMMNLHGSHPAVHTDEQVFSTMREVPTAGCNNRMDPESFTIVDSIPKMRSAPASASARQDYGIVACSTNPFGTPSNTDQKQNYFTPLPARCHASQELQMRSSQQNQDLSSGAVSSQMNSNNMSFLTSSAPCFYGDYNVNHVHATHKRSDEPFLLHHDNAVNRGYDEPFLFQHGNGGNSSSGGGNSSEFVPQATPECWMGGGEHTIQESSPWMT